MTDRDGAEMRAWCAREQRFISGWTTVKYRVFLRFLIILFAGDVFVRYWKMIGLIHHPIRRPSDPWRIQWRKRPRRKRRRC